ncbi:hypothetical protein H2198_005887 [Neophaeococcomyces mojaviensis]|uniref:Uncharacterized protein n=1 Tax=Neophaeococcomyces mojaviensis TaxID=3383035 RepID=A0ACC3A4E3_9EURO|nr:hypothetical protein H2198_005887 [Knufia sp. JES_112]
MTPAVEPSEPSFIDRQTLCIAGSTPGLATHAGEDDFAKRLRKYYLSSESNAAENLIHFKTELAKLNGEAFWTRLMTGMTEICSAQFAFVSKRILVDDHHTAVEMPKIGEEGSCLMAVALYYNDGKSIQGMLKDYKYYAWSAPCAYMKHDKVFLIPEDLNTFITDNPNQFPFEPESYLGVPLHADGKCYAHFGMMWTKEGMKQKEGLSWAFIEMFMHSLEDMISQRLLAGQGFAKSGEKVQNDAARIIPQSAVAATQSLKLYARSLSHELRTPMQGVVGMLDLMYATVQEQLEGQTHSKVRQIFQTLKNNIEVVQDSSKRAIEAADNVVQAYDLNMQVPDTPSHDLEAQSTNATSYFDIRPNMTDGSQIVNTHKRKRIADVTVDSHQNKMRNVRPSLHHEIDDMSPKRKSPPLFPESYTPSSITLPKPAMLTPTEMESSASTPGLRQSNIREVLPVVISDSLRTGGRPDFASSKPTPLGERIEARTRSSNGFTSQQVVIWTVEPDVPYMIPVDEKDLSKLVGAVFLNAVKFTENGEIDIRVRLSNSKKYVLIDVADTGTGIPENFQPELFKPFSKEDDSLTRTKEGLGLGLLVAKGLARRIGGDLTLVRTAVEGPSKGTEFEIKIPLELGESSSRSSTPFRQTAEIGSPRSVPLNSTPINPKLHITSSLVRTTASPEPTSPTPTILRTEPRAESPRPNIQRRISSTPCIPTNNKMIHDRYLAQKYPLTFLVAEDNKINRKLLVNMLGKFGYKNVYEAYDGKEAVRVMDKLVRDRKAQLRGRRRNSIAAVSSQAVVDVILMDLWMPEMDGYQATEKIFEMFNPEHTEGADASDIPGSSASAAYGMPPTVLAVSADVTDAAIEKATSVGMAGYMSKPYKMMDLQKLILEFCVSRDMAPRFGE